MVIPNYTPNPFTFVLSKMAGSKRPGGSIKVVDSRNFKAAQTISAVEVTVEVGGMRELHWHPTQHEWPFFHVRSTLQRRRDDSDHGELDPAKLE
ncbi:hypothetical protein B0H11DRAFT_2055894 [Mycena galericulata]|nr:hypothetical protein B0H11DRAFT_2055894 [Mycena galericulata]